MRYQSLLLIVSLFALGVQAAPVPELAGAPPVSSALPTAEAYLQRLRQPVAPSPTAAAGYQPRTAFDNSPYRFDMSQNGRRMTAEEFDAWMKARGIRVATGKPAGESTPAAPAATATTTASANCQASAQITC